MDWVGDRIMNGFEWKTKYCDERFGRGDAKHHFFKTANI
jgi:hypothetical protein